MRFLLVAINAKYIHSNPAVYSLRAYAGDGLRQYIEVAEYTVNQPMGEILADIYGRRPDVVGFSCYIWNWRLVQELLGELPKLLPGTRLWLGGPEVSYDADVILRRCPQLSGIMVGEGEETFRELLEYYVRTEDSESLFPGQPSSEKEGCHGEERGYGNESVCEKEGSRGNESVCEKDGSRGNESGCGKEGSRGNESVCEKDGCHGNDSSRGSGCGHKNKGSHGNDSLSKVALPAKGLHEIPGLCLPEGYTRPRTLMDMDSIPFLYDDLKAFENKILYYESSRGCPFRCSYCLSSLEKPVRVRDISVVKRELQFFLDNKVKQVKFVDRTFNCDHSHAMAVWQYLQEHDNGVTNFHFEISADLLQEDELALLEKMRPGLVQLEIGVQSVNPRTLEAIRRRSDLAKLEQAVAAIRRGGNIHQHLDLIAGLPYEDYESFSESFDQVYAMEPDQLQLGFLKLLKGSEMWERAEEYGIRCLEQPPYEVLCTRWLSYEEILRLKRIEEMVELYYNSMQFTHTLPFLEQAFSGPFAMYEALADFCEKRGCFTASPARAYRYQLLLAFASERDSAREAVYRELLTYDMYLRENLKSRPEFAPDLKKYKDEIQAFYQEEAQKHRYLPGYRDYDWKQLSKMTHLEPFRYPVWDVRRMLEGYEGWGDADGCGIIGGGAGSGKVGYGVTGIDGIGCEEKALYFVLFDYQKRNPLNHGAETRQIC